MKMMKKLMTLIAVAVIALALAPAAQAADVTWEPQVLITNVGDSVISTEGTLVSAINAGPNLTVNGVPFCPLEGSKPITTPGFTDLYRVSSSTMPADPNNNMSTELETLLYNMAYDDDYDGTYITLSGLVPTKNYLVQFLVFDPRSQGYSSWDQSYTGGTATAGPYTCINAYSLVGRWVADGTSQAFTLSQSDPRIYGGNQNIIICAVQWRMIPPPAGTLIMVK